MQRAGAIALLVFSTGFLLQRCALSADVPFLTASATAPWIAAPLPPSAALQQWGRERAPVVSFSRRFGAPAADTPVQLELRALRRFALWLNGEAVPAGRSDGSRWREASRFALTSLLRPGENELRVDVTHLSGPALLSLRVEGLGQPLTSDASWTVAIDGRPLGAAIAADDTRVNPATFAVDTPLRSLVVRRDAVLGLLVLGVLGFLAGRRFLDDARLASLPSLLLATAALAWAALFAAVFLEIPLELGFDVSHHRAYLEFLSSRGALPLATDGWSMYQPPLFYAASLAAVQLTGAEPGSAAPWALKLIPFLCGLGNVWIGFALAGRLFPGDVRARALAVLFAAVLPMNLYSSAYFSNETPHAFLAGLALLCAVDLLLAARASLAKTAALAALLGLAALTKFTALLLVPLALFFLVAKLWIVEGAPARRCASAVATFALVFLAVAGWFYARNWIHFGQPVVGNWNLPGAGLTWWQQPGFHTSAYYTGFGEALRHPYLAGFHSFWDGIYSTLWGDGGIAGRALPADRHGFWNYDFMSIGYLLALPATALLLFGALRCVAIGLGDADARRRAAFSFLTATSYAVGFAILYMTVRLPFFAQAKAFYGLLLAGPLAVFFAAGAARLDGALAARGWLAARSAFYAWLFLFAVVLFASYAAG
ncbi:MAG: hypothetical protein V3U03_01365 [Myxococcota bacterium]